MTHDTSSRHVEVTAPPVRTRATRIGLTLALLLASAIGLLVHSVIGQDLNARSIHLGLFDLVLPFAFVLIPYVAAFVLLTRRSRLQVASGSGLAFGLFVGVVFGCVGMALLVFLLAGFSGEKRALIALGLVGLLFLTSIWVIVCALKQIRTSVTHFVVSACLCGAYLYIGFPAVQLREYRASQHAEHARAAQTIAYLQISDAARHAIESLTACVIEYENTQSKHEPPASLADLPNSLTLPGGARCDAGIANPGVIADYTITYSPQKDATTGKLIDFRLLAMPTQKGLDYVNPMMSDSRGRIFVYERWFGTEEGEHLEPLLTDQPDDLSTSRLLSLRASIRFSMKNKSLKQPPLSLSNLTLSVPAEELTKNPDIFQEGPYTVKYLGPSGDDADRFAISAVCQHYGDACIRSFLLAYDGEVHQTVEPREATAQDPLIPDCEKHFQGCRDVDWPVP